MFTRIVELTTKPGKARDLSNMVTDKVLPILRKHNGFVDEIILVSQEDPNRVLAMSFWKMKEDAERYHREDFPKVNDLVRPHLERDPRVTLFDVDTFTTHKIAAGKAA